MLFYQTRQILAILRKNKITQFKKNKLLRYKTVNFTNKLKLRLFKKISI